MAPPCCLYAASFKGLHSSPILYTLIQALYQGSIEALYRPPKPLVSLYYASMKPLLSLYYASITPLLSHPICRRSIKALLRLY